MIEGSEIKLISHKILYKNRGSILEMGKDTLTEYKLF